MSRDHILHKVRTALGRSAGQPAADAPPMLLRVPEAPFDERIRDFTKALEILGGQVHLASSSSDALSYVSGVLGNGSAVASNTPILASCGIPSLAGVRTGFQHADDLKAACAGAAVGITGADYALADTGTLVMISTAREARLISLLPPVHIALVARGSILTGLDELLTVLPRPAEQSSSMVLITGPSRTADIEQILVRGVHGPGAIHAVIV